jgi:hypothetical protein
MELARERGVKVVEERFTRDELYIADEVFMTGTAAELTPIREVDDRTVGTGKPGPITVDLQNAFFDIVKGARFQARLLALSALAAYHDSSKARSSASVWRSRSARARARRQNTFLSMRGYAMPTVSKRDRKMT